MKTNHSRCTAFGAAALAVLVSACQANSPTPPSQLTPTPSPSPQPSVIGSHTVSWIIGDECAVIPAEARQRSYDATIENDVVTLRSGAFLEGPICTSETQLGCNQFRLTQNASTAAVDMLSDSEYHGGGIVERLPSGTWLELTGKGTSRLEGTAIKSTLEGSNWYCPDSRGYPFPCSAYQWCKLQNLQLTIAKKNP